MARRGIWLSILACILVSLASERAIAQAGDDLAALHIEIERLTAEGQLAEALDKGKQYLTEAERRHGASDLQAIAALGLMAQVHVRGGRHAEAEPLLQRLVTIHEAAGAQHQDQLIVALELLAQAQQVQRKLPEAEQTSSRALALAERTYADAHHVTATILFNRAVIERDLGRLAEAERSLRRAMELYTQVGGPETIEISNAKEMLGLILHADKRPEEAIDALRAAIAIREKSAPDAADDLARQWTSLGVVMRDVGRFEEARQAHDRQADVLEAHYGADHLRTADGLSVLIGHLMLVPSASMDELARLNERLLAIRTRALGLEHAQTIEAITGLGFSRLMQTRPKEAEQLFRQALALSEQIHGARSIETAAVMSSLGVMLSTQSRLDEAEQLLQTALAIRTERFGPDDIQTAGSVLQLGMLKLARGRHAEAEVLLQKGLRVQERVLGESSATASTLVELAGALSQQGRGNQAAPLLQRALAIHRRTTGNSFYTAVTLTNLADVYGDLGRHKEAEQAAEEAARILATMSSTGFLSVGPRAALSRALRKQGRYEPAVTLAEANVEDLGRSLPPGHPLLAGVEEELAGLYDLQGRYAEAEPIQQRVLDSYQAVYGPESERTVRSTNGLAWLRLQLGRSEEALALYEQASAGWVRRRQLELASPRAAASTQDRSELSRNQHTFAYHVIAAWRVMQSEAQDSPRRAALVRRSFELAQWANLTDAAAALAQMSVRTAAGTGALAGLARRLQDLSRQWQALDQRLLESLQQQASSRTQLDVEAVRRELAATEAALADVKQKIESGFPEYAALAFVKPMAAPDARRLLHDNEALLQVLSWGDDTFLWLSTRAGTRWIRRNISWQQMRNRVDALRCGLDGALWQKARSRLRCRIVRGRTRGPKRPAAGTLPPFDLALAHDTYNELLGEFADDIKGKHLIVVPSGPLTQLPFEVLVARATAANTPPGETLRRADWLGSRQPITVLPSVSSLEALRRHGKPSAAERSLVGFGNPLLDGPDASYAADARRARERQACAPRTTVAAAGDKVVRARGGMAMPAQRSGRIELAELRRQVPLPDTVDELCAVAASLAAPANDIYLGARASERTLKALNASGALARFRVLHFATHGALAGEIAGASEPGLVMSPPAEASADDDGYLAASEIVELKLDADWVILSACNTAAGGAKGAEALSGLARAFFYAGARALLVSHWAVYSSAAVELVTAAFSELRAAPGIGRAEAMRRARAKSIARGSWAAHPAYWAPFTVVGEGGAGR